MTLCCWQACGHILHTLFFHCCLYQIIIVCGVGAVGCINKEGVRAMLSNLRKGAFPRNPNPLEGWCTDSLLTTHHCVWLVGAACLPQGKGMDCKGVCNAPAADTIFRYRLPTLRAALAGNWATDWVWSGNAKWETMPSPRVFADAVLLPNGEVAVLNGARYGVPGGGIDGGSTAKGGAFTAMLYIPDAPVGERMRNLGTSGIHRCAV